VDSAVVVLATWTVVYHLCLLTGLEVTAAVTLEVAALAGCGYVLWHSRRRVQEDERDSARAAATPAEPLASSPLERRLVRVAAVSGTLATVLVTVNWGWPATAVLWVTAAGAGTAWAVSRLRRRDIDPGVSSQPPERTAAARPSWDAVVALAWATALAVLSMLTLWPNPDDLYYVNLSQWVVDHGTFPLRDTIFSNLVYPMSSWPPMASYDPLVGVLARLAHVHAASVVYVWGPPVATFLSVLALWRLLAAWRVRPLWLALSVALLFLLFDGGSGYAAPGNLFLIRLWQGKVILLCLMVPTLLLYALKYVERPTRRRAGWLFAGGVAAVGLSTTAMFLVPLLAVGGAAPLAVRQPRKALQGFAAMAAYPIAAGVFTVAVGGRSADSFGSRELYRFDPAWFGHEIFRSGPLAVIAVAAVLAGAFLVRHRAARVTTGTLVLITGISLVPGVTHAVFDLVGLGPTLWRVSWVATVAALVGVLAARLVADDPRRIVRYRGPLAIVVVLVAFGVPIFTGRNGVRLEAPLHWQRGDATVRAADIAIARAGRDGLILAPDDVAITIDVMTTRVKTVAPRDYFMDYLRHDHAFHYADRLALVHFANGDLQERWKGRVIQALHQLPVDVVCLPVASQTEDIPVAYTAWRPRFLRSEGFHAVRTSSRTENIFVR
jgi:hypothetical protein